jgi:HD-GYP domain-containing protein (c-di-GMP phosphodiesterase class II)
MTVGRPHRPPLSRYQALEELFRLKGRQFDPGVVEVFERALLQVEKQNAADTDDFVDAATHSARR